MRSDHHGAEFAFEKIARETREKIRSGEYPPGGQLPSLEDFVDAYGHDKMTVRRAMAMLRDEGLISIRPGLGTFVVSRLPEQ